MAQRLPRQLLRRNLEIVLRLGGDFQLGDLLLYLLALLIEQIDLHILRRGILARIEIEVAHRKHMLMLDGPFGRICRKRAIRVPAFILDHIPDIDDDIRKRFARAPNIPDADLPIPEIRVPDGRQDAAERLIARVIRVQRDLHIVPRQRLDAAIRPQIDAVDKIGNVIALGAAPGPWALP